jgi:hypothetical protein
MSGKIFNIHLGPITPKTRFLPLLQTHPSTLNRYVHVVDNYEFFEPYKDKTTIIDINKYRENHPWSKDKEILYNEKDPSLFVKNFRKFCFEKGNFYPLDLMRAAFLHFYENNILNFAFIATNPIMTDDNTILDEYFDKMSPGSFYLLTFNNSPRPYILSPFIHEGLKEKYPSLKITDQYHYFDGWNISFHFKNKEDLLLFYNIWDDVLQLYYDNPFAKPTLATAAGYTQYESVIGYVIKIFDDNFNYKIGSILDHWSNGTTGKYVCRIHDTFLWHNGNPVRFSDRYNFINNKDITTVKDFIKINKEALAKFYYECNLDFEITDETVFLKLK